MTEEIGAKDAADEVVPVEVADTQPTARPTPHGDKLRELLGNSKLPAADAAGVGIAIERYEAWIAAMVALTTEGEARVADLVKLLNEYKEAIEVDLIWDSESEFLYRQKGQLKIDNSILEEWFPWLTDSRIMPELDSTTLTVGPAKAFAAAHFQSTASDSNSKPGLVIRSKDQDFTIGRPTYLRSSFDSGFPAHLTDDQTTYIAYIAAELKTNLDKTMFQEAAATSHDLRIASPGSHYFLICEYLDMTPISSAGTDITEVLVLRAKRTGSQNRRQYSNPVYRKENRESYLAELRAKPVRLEVVQRFVDRVREVLRDQDADLTNAVERGWF
ncbi:Bpu10I family restriction endonuclease [Mycobacterium camsae]|uniref:Bpu10I family restriction endonuclease n=1 Tax=Mycobacterium gordonae TaxID=1778 RepID=UPI0019815D30|nr:Bpu10I family restriction endonuclease [Mycobacterium gordonae]